MVTLVGTQNKFLDALKDLLELEYDALETYVAAINRLEDQKHIDQFTKFKQDHERHIDEISGILNNEKIEFSKGPSGKQLLTIGSVSVSSLMGDGSIIGAMVGVEADTVTAYERMNKYTDKPTQYTDIITRGLEDEQRHKAWMEANKS